MSARKAWPRALEGRSTSQDFTEQEIFYTGISMDWFKAMLGAMLLGAVFINNYLRQQALRAR